MPLKQRVESGVAGSSKRAEAAAIGTSQPSPVTFHTSSSMLAWSLRTGSTVSATR